MIQERREKYNATHTYALCTAILTYVIQEIDVKESKSEVSSDEEKKNAAKNSMRANLKKQEIASFFVDISQKKIETLKDHVVKDAFEFSKYLRHACAHKDFFPHNEGEQLVGFTFKLGSENGKNKSAIDLCESEFKNIGKKLADLYCEKLREVSGDITREAQSVREGGAVF
ncbi:MAG: hypothetical protein LBG69_03085 [Zoogloeaceae bacterium]|jgi:archaellum component FlaD/FlaE|nr:hypothetical protein [Zoogloeaceae bacterium]